MCPPGSPQGLLCRGAVWAQHCLRPLFFTKIGGNFTSQGLQFYSRLVRLQVPKQNCTAAVLNTALIAVTSHGRSAALSQDERGRAAALLLADPAAHISSAPHLCLFHWGCFGFPILVLF